MKGAQISENEAEAYVQYFEIPIDEAERHRWLLTKQLNPDSFPNNSYTSKKPARAEGCVVNS